MERSNGLHIEAHATDQEGEDRIITLYVEDPHVATFTLSPYRYVGEGTSYQSATTNRSGGNGKLTLTAFDMVTHRLSGTFDFTTYNAKGQAVRVSNGVIENLQWFVL